MHLFVCLTYVKSELINQIRFFGLFFIFQLTLKTGVIQPSQESITFYKTVILANQFLGDIAIVMLTSKTV